MQIVGFPVSNIMIPSCNVGEAMREQNRSLDIMAVGKGDCDQSNVADLCCQGVKC